MGQQGHGKGRKVEQIAFCEEEENSADNPFSNEDEAFPRTDNKPDPPRRKKTKKDHLSDGSHTYVRAPKPRRKSEAEAWVEFSQGGKAIARMCPLGIASNMTHGASIPLLLRGKLGVRTVQRRNPGVTASARDLRQQGHGKDRRVEQIAFFKEEENPADNPFSDEDEARVCRRQTGQQGHGKGRKVEQIGSWKSRKPTPMIRSLMMMKPI